MAHSKAALRAVRKADYSDASWVDSLVRRKAGSLGETLVASTVAQMAATWEVKTVVEMGVQTAGLRVARTESMMAIRWAETLAGVTVAEMAVETASRSVAVKAD